MAESHLCPEFAAAVEQFESFLRSQGWPSAIQWFEAEDVTKLAGPSVSLASRGKDYSAAQAEATYERARNRGLGVSMEAVCTSDGRTCAIIAAPKDNEEAERLMYPENGSLKLCVAVPRLEGISRGETR